MVGKNRAAFAEVFSQAGLPDLARKITAKKLLFVSSSWTPEEREKLERILKNFIVEIDAEETKFRENCHWEAPYLKTLAFQKQSIEDLLSHLHHCSPEFLEMNRANFSEYITDQQQ